MSTRVLLWLLAAALALAAVSVWPKPAQPRPPRPRPKVTVKQDQPDQPLLAPPTPSAKATSVARVVVLLDSGVPAKGAMVRYYPLARHIFRAPAEPVSVDAEGHADLSTARAVEVHVSLAGFGDVTRTVVPGSHREVITLGEGRTLRGSVIDEAGKPVAGIKVTCSYEQGALIGEAEAGQRGTFVLRGVPERVSGFVEARNANVAGRSKDFELGTDESVVVRVRHQPRLVVRVVGPDEEVVTGASVIIDESARFTHLHERSPGSYHSLALRPGPTTFVVIVDGWAEARREITLSGTTAREVVVRLEDRATLEGRVRDMKDVPIADAYVGWDYDDLGGRRDAGETRTDEQGRFRIRGLPELEGGIIFVAEGHSIVEGVATPGRPPLDIRLATAGITGRVEPVPDPPTLVFAFGMGLVKVAKIAADGRFELRGLWLRRDIKVVVFPVGRARLTTWAGRLTPNELHDLGTLHLTGPTVRGRVRGEGVEGVEGARVMLQWEESARLVVCDRDGRFEAQHLPADRVTAWVRAPGFAPLKRHFRPIATPELDLVLEPKR